MYELYVLAGIFKVVCFLNAFKNVVVKGMCVFTTCETICIVAIIGLFGVIFICIMQ